MSTRIARTNIENFIYKDPNQVIPQSVLEENNYRYTKRTMTFFKRLEKLKDEFVGLEIRTVKLGHELLSRKLVLEVKPQKDFKLKFKLIDCGFNSSDVENIFTNKKYDLDELIAITEVMKGNIVNKTEDLQYQLDAVKEWLVNPKGRLFRDIVTFEGYGVIRKYLEENHRWSQLYHAWAMQHPIDIKSSVSDGVYRVVITLNTVHGDRRFVWQGTHPLSFEDLSDPQKKEHGFEQIALGVATAGKLVYSNLTYTDEVII